MKSVFTSLIAICLFVLCLFEKEAKQQAIEAQKNKSKQFDNQVVNNQKTLPSLYESWQKGSFIQARFQLASSDSLRITSNSAESL